MISGDVMLDGGFTPEVSLVLEEGDRMFSNQLGQMLALFCSDLHTTYVYFLELASPKPSLTLLCKAMGALPVSLWGSPHLSTQSRGAMQ